MLKHIARNIERIPSAYRPSGAVLMLMAAAGAAASGGVGWLFFETWPAAAAMAAAGTLSVFRMMESYAARKKRAAAAQFEQLLFSVASSLQAGKSLENAFREAETDLFRMYGGGNSVLLRELQRLNVKSEHGVPLESAIESFRKELSIREIDDWAGMIRTCRRTGGDLVQVMRSTARAIVDQMNLERELSVLIAAKRFEAKALSVVPFVIIALFRYGSPEYMAPLYSGMGRAVMVFALILLAAGMHLSARIMRIEA